MVARRPTTSGPITGQSDIRHENQNYRLSFYHGDLSSAEISKRQVYSLKIIKNPHANPLTQSKSLATINPDETNGGKSCLQPSEMNSHPRGAVNTPQCSPKTNLSGAN